MKHIVCIILLVVTALTMRAELGEMNLGGYYTHGFKSEMPGVKLCFKSQHTYNTRKVMELEYRFKKNTVSCYAWSFEHNYLLEVGRRGRLYSITGVSIALWHDHGGESEERPFFRPEDRNQLLLGVNLGAGAECLISRHWLIGADAKYQIMRDAKQLIVSAGIAYRF